MIRVKAKRIHEDAILPERATDGAACFDLRAILPQLPSKKTRIDAGSARTIRTGLAFEIPPGFAMMIYSRSGHGFKCGVRLANCVGVIDSDYRGEVQVRLTNDGESAFWVNEGDRIAQAMLVPVPAVEIFEAAELSDTERGTGGFGSTGK